MSTPADLTSESIKIPTDLLKKLMEVGFLASEYNALSEQCRYIFFCTYRAAPDNEAPMIGLGYAEIINGEPENGIKVLDDALQINPKSLIARAYKAFGLFSLGKLEEGRSLAQETIDFEGADTSEESGKKFAEILLEMFPKEEK